MTPFALSAQSLKAQKGEAGTPPFCPAKQKPARSNPMISKTFNTLGLDFPLNVPETAAEYDQLAKREGACVESAVANTVYRGLLPQVRQLLTDAVAEQTGIERRTKPTGKTRTIKGEDGAPDTTEEIVVWAETEAAYFDRVLAEKGAKKEDFLSLLTSITSKLAFDPSEAEAPPKAPTKVAKKWLDAAEQIIREGRGDRIAAQLASKLGIPVDTSAESLGRAIAEDQRRKSVAAEYV